MNWQKKGLLLRPTGASWMVTHAQNPFMEHLKGDMFKLHFSGRDKANMAHGSFAEVSVDNGIRVARQPYTETIGPGEVGCFDDCGAMPSCIVNEGKAQYMYYTGWSRHSTVPVTFHIGLAMSEDGGKTFTRASKAPVLGRNSFDPYITGSPWVIKERDDFWNMWYVSGTGWAGKMSDGRPHNHYRLHHAVSEDGIEWKPQRVCLDYSTPTEYAFGRPVVYEDKKHHFEMLFSYMRDGDHYRIGYAKSDDGWNWDRDDAHVGLELSRSGWDSDMACYGFMLSHKDCKYMLYNGNQYGKEGVGYAMGV